MGRDRPAGSTPLERRAAIGAAVALAVLAGTLLVPGGSAGPRPAAATSPAPSTSAPSSPPAPAGVPSPDPPDPGEGDAVEEPVPPLRLAVRSREAVLTGGKVGQAATRRALHRAGRGILRTLVGYHTQAFLREENWRQGRYGSAFQAFVGPARAAVRRDLGVLTLGPDAGSLFGEVEPIGGWLRLRVLIDRRGRPASAVAVSLVRVRAGRMEGGATVVLVRGRFFMRPGEGRWVVAGYDVERGDRQATA